MEAVADIVDRSESASPVSFRHYIPGRPLSEFVGVFWYWRGHYVPYSKERIGLVNCFAFSTKREQPK